MLVRSITLKYEEAGFNIPVILKVEELRLNWEAKQSLMFYHIKNSPGK